MWATPLTRLKQPSPSSDEGRGKGEGSHWAFDNRFLFGKFILAIGLYGLAALFIGMNRLARPDWIAGLPCLACADAVSPSSRAVCRPTPPRPARARLDTTTMVEASRSLSLRGTSGERAGERGTFHRIG